jgi:hypothetical protein
MSQMSTVVIESSEFCVFLLVFRCVLCFCLFSLCPCSSLSVFLLCRCEPLSFAQTTKAKVKSSSVKHLRCWEPAHCGDVDAQHNLGNAYMRHGRPSQAVKWWRKAAKQGLVDSQVNLASALECGYAGERDLAGALLWYRKAAAQGDSEAVARVALLLPLQRKFDQVCALASAP